MAYTYFDLSVEVLETIKKPLTAEEIWNEAKRLGFDTKLKKNTGKTPDATIGARLYDDMKINGQNSTFIKPSKSPVRFYLRNLPLDVSNDTTNIVTQNTSIFNERDLHQLLTNFVYSNPHFKCNTKTIYHEKSKKHSQGQRKWMYSDIVGVYFPFDDYDKNSIALMDSLKDMQCKLFSFEMKKEIDFSTLREYYFQAVSNSSWANEGYVVALKYVNESELLDEMRRLNNSFGIGFIKLDAENVEQSEILFSAKQKTELDWDMINRLIEENSDFCSFVEGINDDIKISKVQYKYDEVLNSDDLEKYIKTKKICL